MKDIVQDIKVLSKPSVHIKDKAKLNEILNHMAKNGVEHLQVLSDFDKTITKQHEDGVPHMSSFLIFDRIPSLASNRKYQVTVKELTAKYYPIEIDPCIPKENKIKSMEEWWSLSEKALKGLKVSQEEIEKACLASKPSLRESLHEFFKDLSDANIPLVVFSAGVGDIVLTVLKQNGVYFPNVKVISNFLNFNEEGTIMGFKEKPIHVFNKNEYALKNTEFYKELSSRDNAIVLGDSLGDASMAQGMEHCQNVLKIGFLYEHAEMALPQYLDTFDIVLVDDQTMDVPRAILAYIRDFHASD